MAAASAGRVRNVHTLAEAYCNLIMACTSAGRLGAGDRVVRARRRVRPHARDRAAVRRLPDGPRRRAGRDRPLARGRARAARARSPRTRATCPEMGAPDRRHAGRAAGPAGPAARGRAAARRARGASVVAPRARAAADRRGPARRSRSRCSSAACAATEGDAMRATQLLAAARRRAPRLRRPRGGADGRRAS